MSEEEEAYQRYISRQILIIVPNFIYWDLNPEEMIQLTTMVNADTHTFEQAYVEIRGVPSGNA